MKYKYNHYPVSSKTSNPSIREHVQSRCDKLKRRTTFVKILMLTWDGWTALSWGQVWKFYKCPCNPRRVAFVPPVCPTVKLFCILHIPRKHFCDINFLPLLISAPGLLSFPRLTLLFLGLPEGRTQERSWPRRFIIITLILLSRANIINTANSSWNLWGG